MEPIPESRGRRTAGEIPTTQLCGISYPYSLAYDGLLQQKKNAIAAGTVTLTTERAVSVQLYKIEEEAAKRALLALRDLQGILHFKRDHLASVATRDNYASDRLPGAQQDSLALDRQANIINQIIERAVQP
ncbi:ORFY protein [Cacao swollen shoot Ghana M virus]|uniref:ORFY protein n=1 Tax=Cacao swollen shoot Ghana M virus TaxID=2056883 RepID=A0A2H4U955_9VIRU|nr:ORFY protein [Cacao swollen shoot Ghana M virus]ATZ69483.1 ORFY protein [Cacao swollen shoot Ghana M virus]